MSSISNSLVLQEIARLERRFATLNPFELISALNIHLLLKPDLGQLKGFYYVVLRERYIVINASLNESEQLLIAGHELGHDRLHRKLAQTSPLKDCQLFESASHTEYEANLFACELLISDQAITDCLHRGLDYQQMSSLLGFKPQLIAFKLSALRQRGLTITLPEYPQSRFLSRI